MEYRGESESGVDAVPEGCAECFVTSSEFNRFMGINMATGVRYGVVYDMTGGVVCPSTTVAVRPGHGGEFTSDGYLLNATLVRPERTGNDATLRVAGDEF